MAGGLVLQQRTEVEERCQPACMAWYPAAASQETFLVLANKHHKQRLVNLATKLCRKVVLSPPGSKYVSSMQLLGGDAGFFLLAIGNQLGLQRVPLTGSPADSCGTLRRGDQILSVNETDISGSTHDGAAKVRKILFLDMMRKS